MFSRFAYTAATLYCCATAFITGANLGELTSWQNAWPFADLVKASSPFLPRTSTGGLQPLSSFTLSPVSGYPTYLAVGVVAQASIGRPADTETWQNFPSVPAAYPTGPYIVLWDGIGNFSISGDANATFYSTTPGGRAPLALVIANAGLLLRITSTQSGEHLRNIRIVPAALEGSAGICGANASACSDPGAVFSPRFLQLARRAGALRFAGWQREWGAASPRRGAWAGGRALPTSPSAQTPDGVPLEHIVGLILAAAPPLAWVHAPFYGGADYLAGQAALFLRGLGLAAAPLASAAAAAGVALPPQLPLLRGQGGAAPWGAPGVLLVEFSAGLGYGDSAGPATMAVVDAWEGALREVCAEAGAALAAAGAGGGASAAAAALFPQLRARLKFVVGLTNTAHFDSVFQSFRGAMDAWVGRSNATAGAAVNGVPPPTPLPPGAPAPLAWPAQWRWAFARVDAFALLADNMSPAAPGASLGFGVPGGGGGSSSGSGALGWDNATFIAALASSILEAEVDVNRFAARLQALTFADNSTAPTWPRKLLFASSVGWALRTPDFGAVSALQGAAGNASAAAALAPAAAAEAALAVRLAAVAALPALPPLLADYAARLRASGFDGALGAELLRPSGPPMSWGLLNRASGATAMCGGWSSGAGAGDADAAPAAAVEALFAACPSLSALASGGAAAAPRLPALLPPPPAPPCAPACVWGTCWRGGCVCFPGVGGAACDAVGGAGAAGAPAATAAAASIGVNVAGMSYWGTDGLYRDVARGGSAWIPQAGWNDFGFMGWNYGPLPPLDARGGYPAGALLPGLALGTMHLRDLKGHYPAGTYVLRWQGDAVVDAWMDDVGAKRRMAPGVMELDLTPTTGLNNGLFVRVERSNPALPFRNLSILRAGEDPAAAAAFPFNPAALAFLSNFSTLRFMDLGGTNDRTNGDTAWPGPRDPRPGDRTYAGDAAVGVPLEDQILLANAVGAHAWVNIPHAWSDAAVAAAARAWAAGLRPGLNLTVEYSNEVWGTLFAGGQYAQARGLALGMAQNLDDARFCFLGNRSRQIWGIFEAAWPFSPAPASAAAWRARLRFVLASQFVNADVSRRILACGGAGGAADALAVAPYLDPPLTRGNSGRDADLLTVDGVLNASSGTAWPALSALVATCREHAALARAYNLSLVAYEGGQGLTGGASSFAQALAIAVNRDPRMAGLYRNYTRLFLDGAPAGGCGASLLMHFSSILLPSRYGSWGLQEALDSPLSASPKAAGLLAEVDARRSGGGGSGGGFSSAACPQGTQGLPCSGPQQGRCVPSPWSGGPNATCACFTGFSGAACATRQPIDISSCSYQCSGHGECVLQRVELGYLRYFGCDCQAGYGGPRCTAFTCPANCNFNGRCVGPGACACYGGFTGSACATDCGCGGHGVCAGGAGGGCACDAGYAFVGGTCTPVCAGGCAPGAACKRPGVCSCAPACVHGECLGGACKCWAGWMGPTCAIPLVAKVAASTGALARLWSPAGVNLAGLSDWSTETPFLDLAATARPWISQWVEAWRPSGDYTWNVGTPQNLTVSGYPAELLPGQALGTLIARDVGGKLPSGRYVVTWEGSGWLEFGFDATLVSERRGRALVDVALSSKRDNGIYLRIVATDPANPLRRLRVMPPGAEDLVADGLEFHPAYLHALANFSAVRFMDWASTNVDDDGAWHVPSDWARRPTRDFFSFQGRSAPLESMVHLANLLGADPWFNVHHASPPSWVLAAGALVKAQLRPDLRPALEFSNEVWNALFAQGAAAAAGAASGQGAPAAHAGRAAAAAAAWEAGGWARGSTAHVLSTFTANPWYTGQLLAARAPCAAFSPSPPISPACAANGSAAATFPAWHAFSALGVSAYLDCGLGDTPEHAAAAAALSVAGVLAACAAAAPGVTAAWAAHGALLASAAAAGAPGGAPPALPLAVYEGGPGLVEAAAIERGAETPGLTALLAAANRDPGMEALYGALLDGAASALGLGGGRARGAGAPLPFFHYSSGGAFSKYGSWGLLEYTGQPLAAAPKARAVAAWVARTTAGPTRAACRNPAASNADAAAPYDAPWACVFPPTPLGAGGGAVAVAGVPLALTVPPGAVSSVLAFTLALEAPGAVAALRGALGGSGDAWGAASALLARPANATAAATAAAPPLGPRAIATDVYRVGPAGAKFFAPLRVCVVLVDGGSQGPSALNLSLAAVAANASGGVGVGLYISSDGGNTWESTENSTLERAGGGFRLCGSVWHFSLIAGLAAPATVLSADEEAAVAARLGGGGAAAGAGAGAGSGPSLELVAGATVGGLTALALLLLALQRAHARRAAARRRGGGGGPFSGKHKVSPLSSAPTPLPGAGGVAALTLARVASQGEEARPPTAAPPPPTPAAEWRDQVGLKPQSRVAHVLRLPASRSALACAPEGRGEEDYLV
jgi:hypothetical protein